MSVNRVFITGNLTREPELKSTSGGSTLLTFGVAVNERKKNQQTGEWEDVPNFVECVMFGSRAQSIAQYLSKGSKVAIDGKLRYSAWTGQDGSKRSKLEVMVEDIEFLSSRQRQQGQYQQQYQQAPQQQAPQKQFYPNQAPAGYQQPNQYDENIPF